MRVNIVGPNLPREAPATFEVHAEGCAHLKRGYLRRAIAQRDGFVVEVRSQHDAVDEVYGPQAGSFYLESGTMVDGELVPASWEDGYVQDFYFAPCVKDLPYDHEPEPEQPISAPYVHEITIEHPVTKQLHDAWVVLEPDGQTLRAIFLNEANAQHEFANRVYPRLVQPV